MYDDYVWRDLAVGEDGVPNVVVQRMWSSLAAYWDPGIVVVRGTTTLVETRLTAACPDADTCFSDWNPAMAFDQRGFAHVVFTRGSSGGMSGQDQVTAPAGSAPSVPGTGLYYATNASGTWVVTRLTTGASDGPATIALDADGAAHVVVPRKAGSASGLHYLTNAGGTWTSYQLTDRVEDTWPSIGIDAAGGIHVAYSRRPLGLYYLHHPAAGGWSSAARLYEGNTFKTDLALDGAGHVGIAFNIADDWNTAAGVLYASNAASTWGVSTVAGGQGARPLARPRRRGHSPHRLPPGLGGAPRHLLCDECERHLHEYPRRGKQRPGRGGTDGVCHGRPWQPPRGDGLAVR